MSIPGFTADRSIGPFNAPPRLKTMDRGTSSNRIAPQHDPTPTCTQCLDSSAPEFRGYSGLLPGCAYMKCCPPGYPESFCSIESCGCPPSGMSYQPHLYGVSDVDRALFIGSDIDRASSRKYLREKAYYYPFKWPP